MLLKLNLEAYMHWGGRCIHALYMIFCVWLNNAQTPCTIKSNTFNHRMLKPKGEGQNQKCYWNRTNNELTVYRMKKVGSNAKRNTTSARNREESQVAVHDFLSIERWVEVDLHCLLRCGASRRAGCRTRSPRYRPGPEKPAWRSSPAEREDACSPSGTCYS